MTVKGFIYNNFKNPYLVCALMDKPMKVRTAKLMKNLHIKYMTAEEIKSVKKFIIQIIKQKYNDERFEKEF